MWSRWQWSCNWEWSSDLSDLSCSAAGAAVRGAMLQIIMQLQGGPRSQYASDITGKYSRTFPDPVCCRILRNDAKYSPGNMRGHLSQLPHSGRCALSALVSPPARFSDKCCPRHRNNPDKHWPGRGGEGSCSLLCGTITTSQLFTPREKSTSNASTPSAGQKITWRTELFRLNDNYTNILRNI